MHIGYVFDEGFARCASVSIVSLLENNKDADFICIYIFDDGISEHSKQHIVSLIKKYNRSVEIVSTISAEKKLTNIELEPWRGKYSAYYKLMVKTLLESSGIVLDRFLMLDADTVIDSQICELWDYDLNGKVCGMALEGIPQRYHEYTGLNEYELYNAGMILFDLKKWNDLDVEDNYIDYLKNVCSHYMLPEEDSFSIFMKDCIQTLEPKYNYICQFYLYATEYYYKKMGWETLYPRFYSLDEIKAAKDSPSIYHCIDTFTNRPWHKNNCHPYAKIYDKYYVLTNWLDMEKGYAEMSIMGKIEYLLRKCLPNPISKLFYFGAQKIFYTKKARKFYDK